MATRVKSKASAMVCMVTAASFVMAPGSGAGATPLRLAPNATAAGASTLVVAVSTGPSTLDPQGNGLLANRLTWDLAYQCLLNTTNAGVIVPELATKYTVSSNGLHYIFTLRQGVQFQNGDPFNSSDVVYTFNRLFKVGAAAETVLFSNYKSVAALGPYSVEFNLSAPNAGFAATMASPQSYGCAIVDQKAGLAGELTSRMVGTGPWEQTAYSPNESMTLTRFANYWGPKAAAANLEMLYVPVATTEVTDLEAGKVDLLVAPEPAIVSLKGDKAVQTVQVSSDDVAGLQLNNDAAPFSNVDARRAVSVALDRAALGEVAYAGGAVATGPVPPSYSWATPLSKLPYSLYNPAQAKKLLAEAGYPHGVSVTMKYLTNFDWGTNALMAQVAQQLGAVGINVTLQPEDVATWAKAVIFTTNYQIGWNEFAYYSDPYTYVQLEANRFGKGVGPIPPQLNALQNAALSATPSGFTAAINKITYWQYENAFPNINLVALDTFAAYLKAHVSNVNVLSSGSTEYLANVKVS
jgi:ABC-type transport system substrate-binding protein